MSMLGFFVEGALLIPREPGQDVVGSKPGDGPDDLKRVPKDRKPQSNPHNLTQQGRRLRAVSALSRKW